MEKIIQILGMGFVGIIMICLGWTIVEYIFRNFEGPSKRNKKLLERAEKLTKKKWKH